ALGYHFRLDLRQTRKRLLRCIHMSTLLPLGLFYAGRGTVYTSNIRTVSRCALCNSASTRCLAYDGFLPPKGGTTNFHVEMLTIDTYGTAFILTACVLLMCRSALAV